MKREVCCIICELNAINIMQNSVGIFFSTIPFRIGSASFRFQNILIPISPISSIIHTLKFIAKRVSTMNYALQKWHIRMSIYWKNNFDASEELKKKIRRKISTVLIVFETGYFYQQICHRTTKYSKFQSLQCNYKKTS